MSRSFRGQLDDVAVRIAEIGRVDDTVVGDAAGLDASRLALGEHRLEIARADFERNVEVVVVLPLEIERHVRRLEEGNARAVVHSVEGVKRPGRPSRIRLVDLQRRGEWKSEEILVELPRLLRVAA